LTGDDRPLEAGRVGRAHGLDGSFYVVRPAHSLAVGTEVTVGELRSTVERRAGTDDRPLVRLATVGDRNGAEALRGQTLLVLGGREDLATDQWYDDDLIGCRVEGLGEVRGVLHGPSCDVLEVGDDKVLVPLVRDAVRRVDLDAREIEVDLAFLGLGGGEEGER
jgi:16S rRNA processing protein RimM